ncbi:peroxiredoxin family protein [bacterium]|nr:peroxiredoxin family protein [bacterium]
MTRFEERRPEFERKGARVAAVSVDPVDVSQELSAKLGLHYPILSDPSGETIRAWGVWHAEKKIALPSVFVVDSHGVIRWKFVSPAFNDRPPEDDVLEAVGKVGQ